MSSRKTVKVGDINWYPSYDYRETLHDYVDDPDIRQRFSWDKCCPAYLEYPIKRNRKKFDYLIMSINYNDVKIDKIMNSSDFLDIAIFDKKQIIKMTSHIICVNHAALNVE